MIKNKATIQFEVFAPLTTNETVNIIDSTPPNCLVNALPTQTRTLDIPISWTGTDAVGEIRAYSVFKSVDGGPFAPLVTATASTSTIMTGGEVGRTYGFYCTAVDTAGNAEPANTQAEATTTIVGDSSPPALTVSLSPAGLWPPDHKLAPVQVTIQVSDDSDPNPRVELVSITSSEPDNGLGDGDTPDDIQDAVFGTDDRQFQLRAERSGNGNGRVYTVTYKATDASGNETTVSGEVRVPKSNGR